ncbi:MAG: hypothetical protein PHU21_00325 [Elusimicrobia bacterium]|nr:hypothetical protein [Elusimicrobiota bacterium]
MLGPAALAQVSELSDLEFAGETTRYILVGPSSAVGPGQALAITAGPANGANKGGDVVIGGGSSSVTFGDVLLSTAGGRVGIGTSSPSQALDVVGGVRFLGSLMLSGSTLAVTGQDASGYSVTLSSGIDMPVGTINAGLFVGNGGGLTGVALLAATQTFTGNDTFSSTAAFTATMGAAPGVTISSGLVVSAGNVGIGTANPTLNLSLGNSGARTFGVQDAGAVTAPGNDLTIQAGAGGAAGTGGGGGDLALTAGAAGGSAANSGGSITLSPGAPTGTGATGFVTISGGGAGAHLRATQTTAPTVGTPSSCGYSPSAAMAAGSTDMAGAITITSGGGAGVSTCATVVTFHRPYAAAPKAILITGSPEAAYYGLGVSAKTNATFTVAMHDSPANLAYTVYYIVIE